MRYQHKLPEYWVWQRMKQRCYDKNVAEFSHYGGRGIKVCERWHLFDNFYADMGKRPEGLTIERIDNDKDYSPDNCRWATRREQVMNRKMTRWITHQGVTMCMADWARKLGMRTSGLKYRLDSGWPIERALQR